MKANRQGNDIFREIMGGKKSQPRILYPGKLCFKNKSEIRTLLNKTQRRHH